MTIDDLIRHVEAGLEEWEETWEENMSSPGASTSDLVDTIGRNELYRAFVLHNNSGFLSLTRTELEQLRDLGFLAESDVVYHPDHWEPGGVPGDTHGCFYGHDGAVTAKTELALEWMRSKHLIG